jgi:hypothetical protein
MLLLQQMARAVTTRSPSASGAASVPREVRPRRARVRCPARERFQCRKRLQTRTCSTCALVVEGGECAASRVKTNPEVHLLAAPDRDPARGCRACAPRQSARDCDYVRGSQRSGAGRARGEARRGVRSVGRGNNGNAHGSLGIGRVRPHPRESLQTRGFSERVPPGANVRPLIAPRRSPVRVRLAP